MKPELFKNLGHRGLTSKAPENTLSSFRHAIMEGASGFELDVRLTRDKEIVVIHDSDMNRTSTGRNQISRSSLKHLKRHDFGSWFHSDFVKEPIPTLAEVLDQFPNACIIVEIKARQMEESLAELMKTRSADRIIFTSFFISILRKLHSLAPQLNLGINIAQKFGWQTKIYGATELGLYSVHMEQRFVNHQVMETIKDGGLRLIPWVKIDCPKKRLLKLIDLGINGLISGTPSEVAEVISSLDCQKFNLK
jgi:glycerophosphoryl diester phosphodiesterase